MAQQIEDTFDFSRRRKTHDFTEYADGKVWNFTRGEDYQTLGVTFVVHAKRWAEENDYELNSKILPATEQVPENVVLRFTAVHPNWS